MKIDKYLDIKMDYYTKALRFFKGKAVKCAVSYSVKFDGSKWSPNRKVGYYKMKGTRFTARAIVFGKLKLSLVAYN